METNPTREEYQIRIAALEKALAEVENQAQKYADELNNLRQQYADDLFEERRRVRQLHTAQHQLQQDYENLRVQKGGFGFKMLAATGFASMLLTLMLCFVYLKLKPKPDDTLAFEQFKREHLFSIEYALSHGQFAQAQITLQDAIQKHDYQRIHPEIEFARKIVGAAERGCRQ